MKGGTPLWTSQLMWEADCKFQHLFMLKTFKKLRLEGYFQNMIKDIYENPLTDIILSGEDWKVLI